MKARLGFRYAKVESSILGIAAELILAVAIIAVGIVLCCAITLVP